MRDRNPDMAIVTVSVDGERAGCLVGFHGQSSIDPERYALWLSKANHTCRLALQSTHLGVHFLSADQHGLAEVFGTLCSADTDKFALAPSHAGSFDVPVLDDCDHRLIGRRAGFLDDGGDHICFVIEPVEVHTGDSFSPLRFERVRHLDPGHGPEQRNAEGAPGSG